MQPGKSKFAITLAAVLIGFASSTAIAKPLVQCLEQDSESLSVPTAEGLPLHEGVELPEWQVRRLEPIPAHAQQGGFQSNQYALEEVSPKQGGSVVEVSNRRFATVPVWKDLVEWIQERLAIAKSKEYRGRSRYWISRPVSELGKPIRGSKIETTYAITWGKFSRSDIEGVPPDQICDNLKFRLPEEKTLRRPVTRYFDKKGRGIAFEFRAVSKDPETTPAWLRDEGLTQMIRGILEECKKFPELYNKPIVTCYADGPHRALYEHWLGMKLQSETTPENDPAYIHDQHGKEIRTPPWWFIQVSPEQLEKVLVERNRLGGRMGGLNRSPLFAIPGRRRARASTDAPLSFDSNNQVTSAKLQNQTKLEPGIVAAKGATAFWVDQNLVRVSATAAPYTFRRDALDIAVPRGATLEWDSPHLRAWLSGSEPDRIYFEPNFEGAIRNFPYGSDEWEGFLSRMTAYAKRTVLAERGSPPLQSEHPQEYQSYLAELNKKGAEYRKLQGKPRLARVLSNSFRPIFLKNLNLHAFQVEFAGDTLTARLTQNERLPDGILAAAGTDLELQPTTTGVTWIRVALAEDITIGKNKFKKGTVLVRAGSHIAAYTAPGEYELFPL